MSEYSFATSTTKWDRKSSPLASDTRNVLSGPEDKPKVSRWKFRHWVDREKLLRKTQSL
jgi:hypothetical protein